MSTITSLKEKRPRVLLYLIGGKARHGKDSLADMMQKEFEARGMKVARNQISKTIKNYVKDYFDWDGSEENKPRKLLQELGTDIIRVKLNKPELFINRVIEDTLVLEEFFDVLIISDIRFSDEFIKISKAYPNAKKILIERPNYQSVLDAKEQKHATETGLDDYHDYDYIVNNDQDLKHLENLAKEIVRKELNDETFKS